MDYIYGVLNEKVKSVRYEGVETDTTITSVNNTTGSIAVTSKITEQTINNKINALDYQDSEEEGKVVTSVSENNGIISVTKQSITTGSNELIVTVVGNASVNPPTFSTETSVSDVLNALSERKHVVYDVFIHSDEEGDQVFQSTTLIYSAEHQLIMIAFNSNFLYHTSDGITIIPPDEDDSIEMH